LKKTACKKQNQELQLMHELRQTLNAQIMQTPKTLSRMGARARQLQPLQQEKPGPVDDLWKQPSTN
jgi:hypothetical protein